MLDFLYLKINDYKVCALNNIINKEKYVTFLIGKKELDINEFSDLYKLWNISACVTICKDNEIYDINETIFYKKDNLSLENIILEYITDLNYKFLTGYEYFIYLSFLKNE